MWCVEYVVRSREARGAGLGCFAMAGLLEAFEARFGDDGISEKTSKYLRIFFFVFDLYIIFMYILIM